MFATHPRQARSGRTRGWGGAMGDDADPVTTLITQVNRFGPAAPAAYRIAPQVFELATGSLAPDAALAAILIFQRRASAAYDQFHDAGSESAIARANAGFADPVTFVMGNIAEVTSAVAGYGDSVGLPPAAGAPAVSSGTSMLLVAAGIGLVLWWMMRKS
jgi:hypothetical protein